MQPGFMKGRQGCVWMREDPDTVDFGVDFTEHMTKARLLEIKNVDECAVCRE